MFELLVALVFLAVPADLDDATRAAIEGRSVVLERDADGTARIIAEATVDRQPRVVGHGRKWMNVPLSSIAIAQPTPLGSCDSDAECARAVKEACENAGYTEGAKKKGLEKATIITYPDGSKLCTAGCAGVSDRGTTGGVAYISCKPNKP